MQAHSLSNRAAIPHSTREGYFPSPPDPSIDSIADGPGLAHDAGNLLGALTLYCDLLQAPGVLRPEHRHYAEELSLLASRSAALIQRLLGRDASHETTAGAHHLLLLDPVLRRMAQPFAGITLTLPQNCASTVPVTEETLERIVLNLVSNAVTALSNCPRPDGLIAVKLHTTASSIQLSVSDNGPGLPLATALENFTALRFASATSRRGLGLSILDELAQRTGASLELRVRPGHGSTFLLTWPADSEAACASHPLPGRTTRAC